MEKGKSGIFPFKNRRIHLSGFYESAGIGTFVIKAAIFLGFIKPVSREVVVIIEPSS